jgi:hypothetical protein
MVDEATFGTPPTMSRFLEFNSETVQLTKERINSSGLRAGRKVLKTSQWVVGKSNVSGTVDMEFQQQGMGLWLKHMMGAIATTQPNVGSNPTVYEHKATVGQLDGKSYAFQIGIAGADGVQRARTYAGGKVAKWDLSVAVDGLLMLQITPDAISESTAVALATASYATNSFPLVWTGGTITLPGGAVGNISKFDLNGDNSQALARYFMGATPGTKKEQLEEGLRPYAGSVDIEFADLSAYTLYTSGTVGALTAFFEGPVISGSYNYALEITLPAVRFDGQTPNVPGPSLITSSMPFICLDDSSSDGPVVLKYRTVDATP